MLIKQVGETQQAQADHNDTQVFGRSASAFYIPHNLANMFSVPWLTPS
jgi:hypothetical protein